MNIHLSAHHPRCCPHCRLQATSSHYRYPIKHKIITITSASIPLSGHVRILPCLLSRSHMQAEVRPKRCAAWVRGSSAGGSDFDDAIKKGIPASRGDGRGQHVGRDLKGASVLLNDKVPMTRN
ncbi:hypothetical protein HDV57DRAFT_216829 [Trichoderma longibrachiatum]|uniref:Uncharacterized protein n=1 Tax=Trichoderma longibrachiatum ATCC 18648 TaxID=983965 RepID=A0A2T4C7V5_TRILO|nr:hypothetical protein M440DRAFT_1217183 [Trichoderma longibrachiatum ATCC 18648]